MRSDDQEPWAVTRKYLEARPHLKSLEDKNRWDWEWDHNPWGHEGVAIEHDQRQIVWYSHRNNPHGGGGAGTVPYDEFMAKGSGYVRRTPPDALESLFDTVRYLMKHR